ncbi:MAG: gamma-glutamyltransferase [Acidobacteriota bacterium]|nr:gamma-glutamyltransferase [Acidobacteriota bacterium]
MKRRTVLALLIVCLAVVPVLPVMRAADRPEGRLLATRSVTYARHGMVSAAHPLAAQVGVEILRRGGNAVDAAIAVNAALAFLEPVACGPGGDLFAMVWDAQKGELVGLNASGRAPGALSAAKIPAEEDGTIPLYSPYAWTVPGAVDGWFELHDRYGVLPMAEVLAPAIRLAREGAPVPQVIAGAWARSARVFGSKPGFAEVSLPGGRAPREGEVFANPALARTFEILADGGRDAFYKGPIARAIVAFSQVQGGFFSLEDFAGHHSEWVEPISTSYRGVELWELPPNGQGLAALEMLNILELFDIASLGRDSADFWHLMVEAKKLAFADRARFYADPAMVEVPVEGLLTKDYARRRRARIRMDRAAKSVDPGHPGLERGDTTYLAVGDSEGNLVSLIQSNYTGFGSGYVVPELGFGIQNRGALFNLEKGHPNFLVPGKRPFHTIIPAFLTRQGVPWCAFGVMGGATQPQAHAQIVVNLVDFGMNLQEAGDAPRFVHTGSSQPTGTLMSTGGLLHLETGVDPEIVRELVRRGHRIQPAVGLYGGYQAVCIDPRTGVLSGATESRKDGLSLGY